jgi:hypothetical protein
VRDGVKLLNCPEAVVKVCNTEIESYFEETSKPGAKLNDPQRYEAHGMKLLGPPLLG